MSNFDFEFRLLLPDDDQPLVDRAQAFGEWCEGFTQGIAMAGVSTEQLHDEEVSEAMQHLAEFSQLDYAALQVGEDDEHAFMEVSEYARLAVLHIYSDLKGSKLNKDDSSEVAH